MAERKKHRYDRRDAWYVQGQDSMHRLMPHMIPGRTANEAVMSETVDLTAIEKFLEQKNADNPEFKYTFFHVIIAAAAKMCLLRPRLNRFYSGHRLYQRKDIIMTFTVKKKFADDSPEALARIVCEQSGVSPIEDIHEKVKKFVYSVRKENKQDGATDIMDVLVKMPRWLLKVVVSVLRWLEYHGHYPKAIMNEDPYYSSCFASNLGSIKMNAQYHHLAEWGTNSFFMIIGEKHLAPIYNPDGSYEMHDVLDIGMTIDERIADGYYFSSSLKVFRELMAHPELLELPIETPVEIRDKKTGAVTVVGVKL